MKRTNQFKVLLSDWELAVLRVLAKREGLSCSVWLRLAIGKMRKGAK